jgi:hypothetical protein
MLDEQIDLKVKMKSILSVDQFEKWMLWKASKTIEEHKECRKIRQNGSQKKTCRNKTNYILLFSIIPL